MQPQPVPQPPARDPDEIIAIEELMAEVVPNHEIWKITPNTELGGKRPIDLINTPYEPILRNMLRAAKHGLLS
jgi:hypothetical protein